MVVINKKRVETAEEIESRKRNEAERAQSIQDNYQSKGFELVSWVQDHKAIVIGIVIAFFLGGASVSAYLYYQKRLSEEASSAYFKAIKGVESLAKVDKDNLAKWQDAQKELVLLAQSQSSTGVAVVANLYAGHIASETKNAPDALKLYSAALAKLKKTNELYPMALVGLAFAQDQNGQSKEALASFEEIIGLKGNVAKDLALYEAARIAVASKDNDKAKGYIARLMEEFPSSVYERNAKRLQENMQANN
jgi:hypothetical protein